MKGVVVVALGTKAQNEAKESTTSLLKHNRYPTKVLKKVNFPEPEGLSVVQQAHWAKVNADLWSPFDPTLMLDADTRVKGDLSLGFKILSAGWELVIVPSTPLREGQILWNLAGNERQVTLQELGTWRHIMLNSGVVYFRRTERVRHFFETWREEWLRFKGPDQGAMLRAFRRCPVFMWLLGYPFNSLGGSVVDHLFGRAK